uniref:Chromo domain-containing protein n=1 Tax=Xenopus tropicalis TaxID=8364 RepID=A0A6I8SLL9_XENTR
MSVIWAATKSNLEKSSLVHKTFADRRRKPSPPYKVGEKVWLSSKNIRLKVPSPKLGPKFLGPFSISEVINPVAVRLQLPPEMRIPNVFHVSLLKPVVLNHFSSAQSPPSAVLVDGQQEYEVEKILDSRLSRGSLQYLVQWKGFGPEECSWEKDSDVHASRLVKAFHGQFPQKPRSSGPVAPRGGGGTVRNRRSSLPGVRRRPSSRRGESKMAAPRAPRGRKDAGAMTSRAMAPNSNLKERQRPRFNARV